jgi:hypothetical protein
MMASVQGEWLTLISFLFTALSVGLTFWSIRRPLHLWLNVWVELRAAHLLLRRNSDAVAAPLTCPAKQVPSLLARMTGGAR